MVDHGVDSEAVVPWDLQDPQEADLEAEEDEEDAIILQILILWLATGAGCVAIWPVTVPKLEQRRREVAMLALPVEHSSNPGTKAHSVVEEEVGKSGSLASMFCMMMRVTPTPLMKQDNCMCHWTLGKLLPSQLRWKLQMK